MGRQEASGPDRQRLDREEALARYEERAERPMIILALAWLLILILEFTRGLGPFLTALFYIIWAAFVGDFVARLALSTRKLTFLATNWLTFLSLFVPALRILRLGRGVILAARLYRGALLLRVVSSLNRSMQSLKAFVRQRSFGYVILLTFIVIFSGAAGMLAFERGNPGFGGYGDALWWSGMVMTTMASQYWPQTLEGRILAFLLAVYAFAVFGYVTANIASFFIGHDVKEDRLEQMPLETSLTELKEEMAMLRREIAENAKRQGKPGSAPPEEY